MTDAPPPASQAAAQDADDYQIVSCLPGSPHRSLPLFLPRNVQYDPNTNTVASATSLSSSKNTSKNAANGNGGNPDYDEQLVIVPNAGMDMLSRVNKPIGCVSCVGPYRTGKSLLLSRFLRDSKSFRLGPTLEGCTR